MYELIDQWASCFQLTMKSSCEHNPSNNNTPVKMLLAKIVLLLFINEHFDWRTAQAFLLPSKQVRMRSSVCFYSCRLQRDVARSSKEVVRIGNTDDQLRLTTAGQILACLLTTLRSAPGCEPGASQTDDLIGCSKNLRWNERSFFCWEDFR